MATTVPWRDELPPFSVSISGKVLVKALPVNNPDITPWSYPNNRNPAPAVAEMAQFKGFPTRPIMAVITDNNDRECGRGFEESSQPAAKANLDLHRVTESCVIPLCRAGRSYGFSQKTPGKSARMETPHNRFVWGTTLCESSARFQPQKSRKSPRIPTDRKSVV